MTERLALLISLDADGAVRGLENVGRAADRNLGRAESKIDRTAQRMQKGGAVMLGAAGLAATGLYKAGQAASDLEQAVGGTEAVFGDAAGAIDMFAKGAAENMGLSEREFREATTSIGGQLKRMTGDVDFAADRAVELTGVAADLAATYGGTTAEAVQALGAAFRGEADPAERFNLDLKVSAVNAKAVELGLAATTSEVDNNAKAQATLALIMEQSADAQGQFAREAGTAAGQMQTASAATENAMASLGQATAPIIADVAGGLASLADKFNTANDASGGLLSKIAAFGTIGLGGIGAISYATGKVLELRDSFYSAETGITRMGKAVTALGLIGVVAAFDAWADSMSDLNVEASKLAELNVGDLSDQLNDMLLSAIGIGSGIEESAFLIISEKLEEIAKTSPAVIESMAKIAETAEGKLAKNLDDAGVSAEYLYSLVDEGVETNQRANAVQERNAELIGETGHMADQAAPAIDDLAGATGKAADKAEEAGSAFAEWAEHISGMFDPLFAAQDAMLDLEEAQLKAFMASEALAAAEEEVARRTREYGADSEETAEAVAAMHEAETELESAKRETIRAAVDQESALYDLRAEVENGNVSINDAVGKLDAWVAQGIITRDQAEQVKNELALVGLTAAAIPEKVTIDINVNKTGFEQAVRDLTNAATGGRTRISVGGGGGATLGIAEGGLVPNTKYMAMGGPVGTDTVPAWLTPGEFVMQRSAVDRLGVATLARLNAGGSTGPTVNNQWYLTKDHDERSILSLMAWSLA